ncbi:putative nuclease HARBI1 [Scomber scombrus]|uniref:Nuclease HARBI1 n=1 Tax=Scomber scombrus TaxID=13677 RepID=A0AAV1NY58_SCOSC
MEDELNGQYWVIGGSSYNLSKHVLTSVSEPTNEKENRFNQAHAKIHDVMRITLGSMKRCFRCLMQLGFAQEGSLDKKSNIIKACSVLLPPAGRTHRVKPSQRRIFEDSGFAV